MGGCETTTEWVLGFWVCPNNDPKILKPVGSWVFGFLDKNPKRQWVEMPALGTVFKGNTAARVVGMCSPLQRNGGVNGLYAIMGSAKRGPGAGLARVWHYFYWYRFYERTAV